MSNGWLTTEAASAHRAELYRQAARDRLAPRRPSRLARTGRAFVAWLVTRERPSRPRLPGRTRLAPRG